MPLGVYVHYPYCARHCPYCDFNVAVTASVPHARYAEAVCAEITARMDAFADRPPASTIYFGGGTPGMWPAQYVGAVIRAIEERVGLDKGAEITVEFNPEDASQERIMSLLDVGVNRLSLGTQSFDDDHLKMLGRQHDGAQAQRAVEIARRAGVTNLSIDLIHGMRGQSLRGALEDVATAISLDPEHISTYQLTVEDKTVFGARRRRGESLLVDEERLLEFFLEIREALRRHGYTPYEISSAARPGFESRHNMLYWMLSEYLALGAGAHGFRRVGDGGVRWENERHPGRYMAAALRGHPAVTFEESSTADEVLEEQIMTGLRMDQGVSVDERHWQKFGAQARLLETDGLLISEAGCWRVTNRGRTVLDTVILRLLG